ncbi:MAG: MarR family transcriptional regulator [Spirochaetia bacterium]|nr:MarR family transcriptional regulator [Spirochaetia bacterium]
MAEQGYFLHLLERIAEQTSRYRSKLLEDAGYFNLGPSHSDMLYALAVHGHSNMTELARIIHRDKSTVTALARKLEKHGLAERVRYDLDRRVTLVALTPKGRRLRRPLVAGYERLHRMAAAGLSTTDRSRLTALLERTLSNWEDIS